MKSSTLLLITIISGLLTYYYGFNFFVSIPLFFITVFFVSFFFAHIKRYFLESKFKKYQGNSSGEVESQSSEKFLIFKTSLDLAFEFSETEIGQLKFKDAKEKKKYLYFYVGAIDYFSKALIKLPNEAEKWFYAESLILLANLEYLDDKVMADYGNPDTEFFETSILGKEQAKQFLSAGYVSDSDILFRHLNQK